MSNEDEQPINDDLLAQELIVWWAEAQGYGGPTAPEVMSKLEEAMPNAGPTFLVSLIGNAAILLRLLARAREISLDEVVREMRESGTLAHLEVDDDR
jgi:hypothetical protein